MTSSIAYSLSAFLLLAAAPFTAAQSILTRNIPYTTDASGIYRADLYQPSWPGTHPAIVAIHGGSWRSGHKSELRRLCADLATHGYTCFSIDYDTHSHSFPISWQESRAAVAFLRAHAVEYRIDPNRIAVLGTSAGGQLAALVALAPQGPLAGLPFGPPSPVTPGSSGSTSTNFPIPVPPPPPTAVPVAAAVLFNGAYDLHPKVYVLRRYLGGVCIRIPSVCNDASPDNHVHPGAPPIFVGHGTHDHLIPYSQATSFISLLQSAGDRVTPFIATNAGHSYWRNLHWYARNLAATEAFLAQGMPAQGAAPANP